MAYTEEELAGLTDEERAMLEDEEDEGTDGAGEDDGEDQGSGEDDGAEGAGDAGAEADPAGDGGEGAEAEDEQVEAPAAHAPILVAEAPEQAQERLQAISSEKADLRKKYDEGELTFDEYESKVETLDEERLEIRLALKEAETAAKIEQQRQINEREAQINGFLSEHNIKRDFSDLRFAALDTAVKVVASKEENADLGVREILQKAMDLCIEQGVIAAKAKPESAPAVKPRKPIAAPPTLAHVPAADMTGTDEGNRFAYLDRLDPVAREAAVSKLSPADLDAYLAS